MSANYFREALARLSIIYDFNTVKQAQIISVGRTENSITLKDSAVSKFHAYFQSTVVKWIIMDTGSSNSAFLNGEQLKTKEPYS